MIDGAHAEFRSLRSSELSYTENTGKPWIRQSLFAYVSKTLFRQTFLPPKFYTVWYSMSTHYVL